MLHRHISFTCLQFNTLCWTIGRVLFQFNYLLILWTSSVLWYCCLLLLVRGWLRLGALGLVLADAVEQETSHQDTSQDSNNKCNCASNCCHLHSRTSAEGSLYILCKNYNTKHLVNHITQIWEPLGEQWWTNLAVYMISRESLRCTASSDVKLCVVEQKVGHT